MHQKKYRLAEVSIVGYLMATSSLAALEENKNLLTTDSEPLANQTVIESGTPEKNDAQYTYFKDKSDDQMPGDAAMLFHIPGLTLTETGGPLASSQIRYRGLANSRLRIDLEGLSLNNPTTGLSDANAMFLFAAKLLQTNAQSLSITLPTIDFPQAKAVFGYGSQNSIKSGASAGTPLDPYSSIFIAMQTSTTNGRFSYSSPDLNKDDPTNNYVRENNDQHRMQALVKYQRKTSTESEHALLAFNAHEGGIAGFGFSPTKNLRSKAIYSGFAAGVSKKVKTTELKANLANSLFDYGTSDVPKNDEHFLSSTHELTLGIKSLSLPKWLDMEFAEQLVLEQAYELNKTRIGGGFLMKRNMQWSSLLKPATFANFSMIGYHGHGLVFKKDFGLSIEPNDFISLTGRFIRNQRLPTFMEMYANNSFFVGNVDLKKESVWDIELGTNIRVGQHTRLQVTGFLGYLSDVIVNVRFLATKLRPINVETTRRHGIDLGLTVEPLNWLMFETKNSVLWTKVKATGAPLPQAPPFLGLTKVRLGFEDAFTLSLQSRYRGATTANMYGTLRTKPYALFDAWLSARFFDRIGLSLSISNIFNVKTAQDTYETPLPGTVLFGQFEVGNV